MVVLFWSFAVLPQTLSVRPIETDSNQIGNRRRCRGKSTSTERRFPQFHSSNDDPTRGRRDGVVVRVSFGDRFSWICLSDHFGRLVADSLCIHLLYNHDATEAERMVKEGVTYIYFTHHLHSTEHEPTEANAYRFSQNQRETWLILDRHECHFQENQRNL